MSYCPNCAKLERENAALAARCGELQAELLDAAIRYEYQMGGETAASMKWRALATNKETA